MILDLRFITDFALLALRIIVAITFLSSGISHLRKPSERGDQLGLSKSATILLGLAEIVAPLSIALGIYIQVGAALLIIVMLGAIYKKIFAWDIGFYSEESMGWHYDLLLLCANVVFLTTPGRWVIVG
ncbi:MAG TPA: DoxX family protein [Fodinibius sp.]|nr:DoxX family protein [Fodinibius sp.]